MSDRIPDEVLAKLPRRMGDKLVAQPSGCWTIPYAEEKDGYLKVGYQGRTWQAHRLVWTLLRGEIPEGMTLDHLCKNRACLNPAHMEVVTARENIRRRHGLPPEVPPPKPHVQLGLDLPPVEPPRTRRRWD